MAPEWILGQIDKQCDDEEHYGDDEEHRLCLGMQHYARILKVTRVPICIHTVIAAIEL